MTTKRNMLAVDRKSALKLFNATKSQLEKTLLKLTNLKES